MYLHRGCERDVPEVDKKSKFHEKLVFRWFKFTLKPPNRITRDKLRLAIWDTSAWTFWLKFGHKGPWDIS